MLKEVKASLTPDRVAKLKVEDEEKYGFLPDEGLEVTVEYDFGDDTQHAIELFTDKICLSMIQGHILFSLQGKIRNMLAAGKTFEEIQDALYDLDKNEHVWKPTEAAGRKSEVEKTKDKLSKMSPEARARAKEELMGYLEAMDE